MTAREDFTVRFWGVRGSLPSPGASTVKYGGHTSCVEMRCGRHLLIFDAGSGLRPLGRALGAEAPLAAHLFVTHTHIDHIVGFPFFAPFHSDQSHVTVWAGHASGVPIERLVGDLFRPPFFPITPQAFRARVDYRDFANADCLVCEPGIAVKTARLNHPGGVTGFRVEFDGRCATYLTDVEHDEARPDPLLVAFVKGADLVIYDSMYTTAEYPAFRGWGHSTWEDGVRLCEAADAGRLVLFHHAPDRSDGDLDAIGRDAAGARPGTIVAREGETLVL